MRRGPSYLLSTEDRVWLGHTLPHGDLVPLIIEGTGELLERGNQEDLEREYRIE